MSCEEIMLLCATLLVKKPKYGASSQDLAADVAHFYTFAALGGFRWQMGAQLGVAVVAAGPAGAQQGGQGSIRGAAPQEAFQVQQLNPLPFVAFGKLLSKQNFLSLEWEE